MNVSNSDKNITPIASYASDSETSPTFYTGSSGHSGDQTPTSSATQVAQTQLAQAQLTSAFSGTSMHLRCSGCARLCHRTFMYLNLTCHGCARLCRRIFTSTSSTSSSSTLPLTIHLPVTVDPPSSGAINTFFDAMTRGMTRYLTEPLPYYNFRYPSEFDKFDLCEPGFETFNKFIQLNKQCYELGRQFINGICDIHGFEELEGLRGLFISLAAQRGCVALLKLVRRCGVDLDAPSDVLGLFRDTPLLISIKNGDTRAVGALLSSGVDPNKRDLHGKTGKTPFMEAACPHWEKKFREEILQLLVQKGADINAQTPSLGETALMSAGCRPESVAALLKLGVNTELCDSHGETALMLLVTHVARPSLYGLSHIITSIEHLLHAGANIFVTNRARENLLTIAANCRVTGLYAAENSLKLVQLLLQFVDVYINAKFPTASQSEKYEMKKSFLEARNRENKTPLMLAIENNNPSVALELINAGADVKGGAWDHAVAQITDEIEMTKRKHENGNDVLWNEVLELIKQKNG